jgi:drug/metabolite transporter (DMT)-like permease
MGLILWYGSLYYLPLAIAVALGFLSPIFTIIGSKIFLREKLTPIRVIAILLGMIGAFLITRPDRAILGKNFFFGFYILLPMLSSIFWVISKLFSSKLAKKGEAPKTMTLYLLLFMTPISFLPAIPNFVMPSVNQMVCMALIGGLSTIAHLAASSSLALAEVSFLTPFGFVRLIASGMIGFIAFNELPSGLNIYIGMIIILSSLIFLSKDKTK